MTSISHSRTHALYIPDKIANRRVRNGARSGKSDFGSPHRKTWEMLFNTHQSSTRRTLPGLMGRSGSVTFYSESTKL
jgi:hypothetical protein